MPKLTQYLLIAFIIGIVIFGAALLFLNKSPKTTTTSGYSTKSPLNYNDKNLIAATISYTFHGKIIALHSNTRKGTIEIDIDTPIEKLPPIIAHPRTIIFKSDTNRLVRATIQDLAVGQNVSIEINYGLRTKQWTLRTVNILNSSVQPPQKLFPSEDPKPQPSGSTSAR